MIAGSLISLVGASIFVTAGPAYATSTALLAINASVDGVSTKTVNAGQIVTYTVSVSNSGPSDATNTTVSDLLPPGVELGGTSVPLGAYWS